MKTIFKIIRLIYRQIIGHYESSVYVYLTSQALKLLVDYQLKKSDIKDVLVNGKNLGEHVRIRNYGWYTIGCVYKEHAKDSFTVFKVWKQQRPRWAWNKE